jgi:hypothetical protein
VIRGAVAVLRGRLAQGGTYYVRLAFGEWDDRGPRNAWSWRTSKRLCIAPDHSMTAAMVALSPASPEWSEVPAWTSALQPIEVDTAAGQAWLAARHDVLEAHRAAAEVRFAGLRPAGRRLSTIDDGASGAPPLPLATPAP